MYATHTRVSDTNIYVIDIIWPRVCYCVYSDIHNSEGISSRNYEYHWVCIDNTRDILFVFRNHQRHLHMHKAILTWTFRGEKIEKVAFVLAVMNKENDDPDFKKEKVCTQEVIDEICKGYVPANTKRNTEWFLLNGEHLETMKKFVLLIYLKILT